MSSKANRVPTMPMHTGRHKLVAAVAAGLFTILTLMCLPMIALAADDPAAAQYGDQTPDAEVLASSTTNSDPGVLGSLPFTGTDILLLAGAAVVLFAVAAVLRRFGRRGQQSS